MIGPPPTRVTGRLRGGRGTAGQCFPPEGFAEWGWPCRITDVPLGFWRMTEVPLVPMVWTLVVLPVGAALGLPPWTPRSSSVVRVRMLRRRRAREDLALVASSWVVFMVCSF